MKDDYQVHGGSVINYYILDSRRFMICNMCFTISCPGTYSTVLVTLRVQRNIYPTIRRPSLKILILTDPTQSSSADLPHWE